MAGWSRNKVDSATLNRGNEYSNDSVLAVDELNAMVNAGLFAQDFVEQLCVEIDTSQAGYVGTPSVELIDGVNSTTQKPYKRFKFKYLKGATGLDALQIDRNFNDIYTTVGETTTVMKDWFNRNPKQYEVFMNMDGGSNMCLWQFKEPVPTFGSPTIELISIRSCKGEAGDVGATFTYDETTKTLTINTGE